MQHPKLDTPRGRKQQQRNIERSMKSNLLRFLLVTVEQGGDNFRFISWEDLEDLKLWEKRP